MNIFVFDNMSVPFIAQQDPTKQSSKTGFSGFSICIAKLELDSFTFDALLGNDKIIIF